MVTNSKFGATAKKILIVMGVLIGLAVIVIIITVITTLIQYRKEQSNQNKKFQEASANCRHSPIVVIRSESNLLGGSVSYQLYTPNNSRYKDVSKAVTRPLDILGSVVIEGYYCSIDEAKTAIPSALDNANNYSQGEQNEIKREILTQLTAKQIKLYEPTNVPESVKLGVINISKDNYEYGWSLPRDISSGSEKYANLNDLHLKCSASNPDNPYTGSSSITEKDKGGNTIYYEERYGFPTWFIQLGNTSCSLRANNSNSQLYITKEQGVSLLQSLKEIAPEIFIARANLVKTD